MHLGLSILPSPMLKPTRTHFLNLFPAPILCLPTVMPVGAHRWATLSVRAPFFLYSTITA